jgi:hypothetical protein
LRWTDFDFLRVADSEDLSFRIKGTSDKITVLDFGKTDPLHLTRVNRVEQFQFGDGTVWDWQKTLQHFIDVYATAGNDTLYGFYDLDEADLHSTRGQATICSRAITAMTPMCLPAAMAMTPSLTAAATIR